MVTDMKIVADSSADVLKQGAVPFASAAMKIITSKTDAPPTSSVM